MKLVKSTLKLGLLIGFFLFLNLSKINAQTAGTMTFTYTQTATVGTATKNVLAIWIEDANGNFIKTRMRFWGNGTNDHLPSWKAKSVSNVVDAVTGATLTASTTNKAFGTRTVSWDGKNTSGVLVADGTYKIFVESSWCNPEPANNQHKFLSSFTFTKGPTAIQVLPNDVNLSAISIAWQPTVTSINPIAATLGDFIVYPNPSNGIFHIDFKTNQTIEKLVVLNSFGQIIAADMQNELISGVKTLDLSRFADGIYFVQIVLPNSQTKTKMIVLKK